MKSNVFVCCLRYESAHPVYDWCVGAGNEPECPHTAYEPWGLGMRQSAHILHMNPGGWE